MKVNNLKFYKCLGSFKVIKVLVVFKLKKFSNVLISQSNVFDRYRQKQMHFLERICDLMKTPNKLCISEVHVLSLTL